MAIKKTNFRATAGAQFNTKKVDVYGAALVKIAEKYGEEVTPRVILDESRNPKSDLNEIFQWDNDVAAENWRTQQARTLIGCIQIKILIGGDEMWVPVLESVKRRIIIKDETTGKETTKTERVYVTIKRVMGDRHVRDQITNDAMRLFRAAAEHIVKVASITKAPEKRRRLQELADQLGEIVDEVVSIIGGKRG